jgi:hypothetical protein
MMNRSMFGRRWAVSKWIVHGPEAQAGGPHPLSWGNSCQSPNRVVHGTGRHRNPDRHDSCDSLHGTRMHTVKPVGDLSAWQARATHQIVHDTLRHRKLPNAIPTLPPFVRKGCPTLETTRDAAGVCERRFEPQGLAYFPLAYVPANIDLTVPYREILPSSCEPALVD